MKQGSVFARAVLGALVVVAVICGGGAVEAHAATYGKVVGSISNAYPVRNHRVTARGTVLNSRGKAVSGVLVTFSWKINGHTYKTYARTNRKGVASSTRSVGTATAWRKVSVPMAAYVSRHKVTGSTSFVPLPEVDASHHATVRIGVPLPLTQGAVYIGQGMLRGAQLAVAQANASSTITALGLYFVAVSKDDQGNPPVAVTVAKSLVSDPSVLGIAGHLNSGCSIPAAGIYRTAGIPMVTGASTNPFLTQMGYANVFRNMYQDGLQGPAAARAAYAAGYRRVCVVDDSTSYGSDGLADGFSSEFIALGGTVPGRFHTGDMQTSFSSEISGMKALSPDLVYYGGIYNAGGLLSRQMGEAGMSVPMMGGDGLFDPEFIAMGGRNGDMSTQAGYPVAFLPDAGAFASAYAARFPGKAPTDWDPYSYDSARVIIEAVVREAQIIGAARVGTSAGKSGIVSQVAATDLVGATGHIAFDGSGDRLDPEYALYKVVAGSWAFESMVGPGD